MAGTWTSQNKVLPGAYINFKTNKALAITPGDRGTVALLLELNVGTKGDIYDETATTSQLSALEVDTQEYMLVSEALKSAKKVLVYNLGADHEESDLTAALDALKTLDFNTLAYPFDDSKTTEKTKIQAWIDAMRSDEGKNVQGVLANHVADSEGIINVSNGVKLTDGQVLSAAECTAWVAGATAGAKVNQSNTNKKYVGAIDVVPRLTKSEMEEAINGGKFIFKADSSQNVTAVYDINSLTTFTVEKAKDFRKNRTVRVIDNINNDVTEIFEANYMGKVNNNEEGRSLLRASLIDYFKELQRLQAIQNFAPDDVIVHTGSDTDSVVIDCYIQTVDSAEKFYITVNLK